MAPSKYTIFQWSGVEIAKQMALTLIYVLSADGEEIDEYNEKADDIFKLKHMTEAQQAIAFDLCKLMMQSVETVLTEVPDLDPKKLYQSFPALAGIRNYVTPSVLCGLKCWQRGKKDITDGKMWEKESAKEFQSWMEEETRDECPDSEFILKSFYDLVLEAEELDGDVAKVWDLNKPAGNHSPFAALFSYVTSTLSMAVVGYGVTVRDIIDEDKSLIAGEAHMRASIEKLSKLKTFQPEDLALYVNMLQLASGETVTLADKSGKSE